MEEERKHAVPGYSAAPIFTPAGGQPHWQPYSYPPPPPPPSYYPPPIISAPLYGTPPLNNANGGNLFYRRLFIVFCCIFLAFGLITFILSMVLRPTLPLFTISSASVSSFKVSGGQQFSANFNLSFSVRNPNVKMGILYEEIQASVLYQSETLSQTSLPPFYQEKGNFTVVPASFRSIAKYVDLSTTDGISKSRLTNDGVVDFQAAFEAWVRFKSGALLTRKHLLRVFCNNVRVRLSNSTFADGSLQGGSLSCHAYL